MTKFEFRPFDKVLVRDGENQTWRADFYSHEDDTSCPFCCVAGNDWKFCIPYNETTKHLCGTSDPYIDPAEVPAFEFGDVVKYRDLEINAVFVENLGENTSKVMFPKWSVPTNVYTSQLVLVCKGNFND